MSWTLILAGLRTGGKFLLRQLVNAVEGNFGPKTGDVKMQVVLQMLQPLVEALAKAGKLPGIPAETDLREAIESEVAAMKAEAGAGGVAGTPGVAVAGLAAPARVLVAVPEGYEMLIRPTKGSV